MESIDVKGLMMISKQSANYAVINITTYQFGISSLWYFAIVKPKPTETGKKWIYYSQAKPAKLVLPSSIDEKREHIVT